MTEKALRKLKALLLEEEGNSMVEFALVLPMLIVLTIGGIYFSVSYSQKALMNGLTFMQTRAASVRKEHTYIAKHAVDNYKKTSGQGWVEKTKSRIKSDDSDGTGIRDLSVEMTSDAMKIGILANSVGILTGEKPDNEKLRKIKTSMVMPIEYITRGGGSDRPITSTSIDYTTLPVGGSFIKEKLIDKLPETVREWIADKFMLTVLDPKDDNNSHDTKKADRILGADPTYNMDKVNEIYDYWGLNRRYSPGDKESSETPLPKSILRPIEFSNSLYMLKLTGDHVKAIESGATLTDIALKLGSLSPVGQAIEKSIGTLKKAGEVALPIAEKLGTDFAENVEMNNSRNFRKSLGSVTSE